MMCQCKLSSLTIVLEDLPDAIFHVLRDVNEYVFFFLVPVVVHMNLSADNPGRGKWLECNLFACF